MCELSFAFVCSLALQFVHGLVKGVFIGWTSAVPDKKVMPRVTAANAHLEVCFFQSKSAQGVNEQSNQFCIGGKIGFTDNICVKLEVLSQTPFLLALISK